MSLIIKQVAGIKLVLTLYNMALIGILGTDGNIGADYKYNQKMIINIIKK